MHGNSSIAQVGRTRLPVKPLPLSAHKILTRQSQPLRSPSASSDHPRPDLFGLQLNRCLHLFLGGNYKSIALEAVLIFQDPTRYYNKANDSSGIISRFPCRLKTFGCFNLTTGTIYLKLFDSDTGNTSGDPYRTYLIYATGWTVIDDSFWGEDGLYFGKGLSWIASSTIDTVTVSPVKSCILEIRID